MDDAKTDGRQVLPCPMGCGWELDVTPPVFDGVKITGADITRVKANNNAGALVRDHVHLNNNAGALVHDHVHLNAS